MKIICVTGKSGSGKTYISNMLASKLLCPVVDIDHVAHDVMKSSSVKNQVRKVFGDSVFDGNNINRKKLGEVVFSDKQKLSFLENLTQTEMENEIDKIIASSASTYIILEYALLPRMRQFGVSFFNILIEANIETRSTRITKRDGITKEYFLKRDQNSTNYNDYNFDLVISNDSRFVDTDSIIEKIKNKDKLNSQTPRRNKKSKN